MKQSKLHKEIKQQIHSESLPQTSSGVTDEKIIMPYMEVLRKTHEKIGTELEQARIKDKKEKKFAERMKNPNFVKNILYTEKKKNSLKRKIRRMRNEAAFPQPKSYMNYSNRKGLLKKNSIKI